MTICFGLQQRTVCNCKRAVCLRAKVWQFSAQKKSEDHPLIKTSADQKQEHKQNRESILLVHLTVNQKDLFCEGRRQKKLGKSSQAESAWLTAWVSISCHIWGYLAIL